MEVTFGVLGSLMVLRGDEPVHIRGPKRRALLALLILQNNKVVASDRLIHDLWDGKPPASAEATLQSHIFNLRRDLGDSGSMLLTRPPGYLLEVERSAVDAMLFEDLLERGQRTKDPRAASLELGKALNLWRGWALYDFEAAVWAQPEIARLNSSRLRAIEDKNDLDLELGRHSALVPELERLVEDHPYREHLWAQLMLALYRSGRQVDALDAFRRVRAGLLEAGLDPSSELIELELAILRQAPAAGAPTARGTDPVPPTGRRRGRRPPLSALAADGTAPFVGRVRERALLRRALERVDLGRPTMVLVGGEPGAGKTRLVAESAQEAHAAGVTVLYGRCDEDLSMPYLPFVQALGQLADDDAEQPGRLERHLGEHGGDLIRLLPGLAQRVPGLATAPASSPEAERYRMFEAVSGWLQAAARERPLLLVVDDVHWATRPTISLLAHLMRTDSTNPICIVALYRSNAAEQGPNLKHFLGEMARETAIDHLDIAGLSSDDVVELIGRTVAKTDTAQMAELAREVHSATDGNPFFVSEVLRNLLELKQLERDDSCWTLDGDIASLGIPSGVRDVVKLRLSRLGERAVRLVRCAGVLGAEFDLAVLRQLAAFTEDVLMSALDELLDSRFLESADDLGLHYRFCHAIVRSSVYEEMSVLRRSSLHRDAASAIEMVHRLRIDDYLAQIAHHLIQAAPIGEAEKAARYCTRAGHEALARGAADEAVNLYQTALQIFEKWLDPDEAQRCEYLLDVAEGQRWAGDDDQRQTFLEAAEIAIDMGDMERLARAGKGFSRSFTNVVGGVDPERIAVLESGLAAFGTEHKALRARVMSSLAGEVLLSGDHCRGEQLSRQALAAARGAG